MLRAVFIFVIGFFLAAPANSQEQNGFLEALAFSQQMLVVTLSNWQSTSGFLRRFERTDHGWQWDGPVFPVVLGKSGLGWGRGEQPQPQSGPQKTEGDGRSPAGIFPIPYAFGYADPGSVPEIKLPYVQCTATLECVDDTNSSYYNILIDRRSVTKPDWKSSVKMREAGDEYRLGIFVAQDSAPVVPGVGSCVFLHIWKSSKTPTGGSTAMSLGAMESLLGWLDANSHPILVQLPEPQYRQMQKKWQLPDLVNTNF